MSSKNMDDTKKSVRHFYRIPGFSPAFVEATKRKLEEITETKNMRLTTEFCFNVEIRGTLTSEQEKRLYWLLTETYEPEKMGTKTFLKSSNQNSTLIELGPRLNFATAFSTNAVSILRSCGIDNVTRLERSRRFLIESASGPLSQKQRDACASHLHDRMTECVYTQRLDSFDSGIVPAKVKTVPVMKEGKVALKRISDDLGLSFDDWDLEYYTKLFKEDLKRDPTDVECFDLAQSNSEHSRHWFFSGKMVIDGKPMEKTLFRMVKDTLKDSNENSKIAFHDNSSSLQGFEAPTLISSDPLHSNKLKVEKQMRHPLLTAETHNFPTGIAPFAGAETGPGGRIRDVQATGTGAHVGSGIAGYCVGNLNMSHHKLPWEDSTWKYPDNLAKPLTILVDASNGASDYGNKFGEPMICGFTRSFGQRLPCGERREWLKPIMFSAGLGTLDDAHVDKGEPCVGHLIIKIGGPAYRIGMGGGAASSRVSSKSSASLDFNAVQRGDAEMENKMNRVIRACAELGKRNPIVSIHDQGAGGNGNILKELAEPKGAKLEVRNILVGDETLSVLEIWGAEYQENNGALIKPEDLNVFDTICKRERCPYSVVGTVTDDGIVTLHDSQDDSTPFNMPLDKVLGKMPQKTFDMKRETRKRQGLSLPKTLTVRAALDRVLRLVSVGSKRFLTNKVDRSVTGLIVQQQCVGPLQTPLADCAVMAQSHFGTTGAVTAVGEQPIKGLVSSKIGARMAVAEALSNMAFARVTARQDIKCSANWMWPAKLPGDGALMCDALESMCGALRALGVGVDGGKDSLSMAARANDEVVKCPGACVITAYAASPNIHQVVTPDLKLPGSAILLVDVSGGNTRLSGSALAQVFEQIGEESDLPDMDSPKTLASAFDVIQSLIADGSIASGHDRSDGGLATCVLEMCFAGNLGVNLVIKSKDETDVLRILFAEELGFVLEAVPGKTEKIIEAFRNVNVLCEQIGVVVGTADVQFEINGDVVLKEDMRELRDIWESTSFALELEQANPKCVEQERLSMSKRTGPQYQLFFKPSPASLEEDDKPKHRVAVIREEGSNGDREMAAAFVQAGFDVFDVNMNDLLSGSVTLDSFRGIVFVGGFSYGDVLDSAKGWAGSLKFGSKVYEELEKFYARKDTFSLGVCNGCQLLALLGIVPYRGELESKSQPRFVHNESGRFESRFSTVRIESSPSIMMKGMNGSVLGVWVAHGEGMAYFPDDSVLKRAENENLVPIRYVDDSNKATTEYPFNPNGSRNGIAGLCSKDGRHLAMMPHPERCVNLWQWPWLTTAWKQSLKASPWLKMFQNAKEWCDAN